MLVGNTIQINFQVLGELGWVDPGSVALLIKPPTGSNLTPTPSKVGTGRYSYLLTTSGMAAGTYHYRWEGSGGNDCAAEGSFEILASEVI